MTLIQQEPKSIKLGTTDIKKVYLGSTQVRPKLRTFTISWTEQSNMSSGWTYSDDAAGLTAGSTAFDEFFGYSAVLLNLSGTEVEEVKQSSPGTLNMGSFSGALTGTANNVMIKFPVRGVRMSKSGSTVTLSITEELNKAGYQYYAFTKGSTIKDNLYIGAYLGTSSANNSTIDTTYYASTYLKSWATKTYTDSRTPMSSRNISNMRSTASIYGNGYKLLTIYPYWYIACLYMMKYGNPNSQSVIGAGYTSGSDAVAPGLTNSITTATGATSTGNTGRIKLFGLEDRWGNITYPLDGTWLDGSVNLTVDKTNSISQNSAYATNLGVLSSGWMAGIDGSNDGMFRNINTSGGSDSTYYPDTTYCSANNILVGGGSLLGGAQSGVFHLDRIGTSTLSWIVGARLMYL